jgi:amino acid adenylation domain-containing protein
LNGKCTDEIAQQARLGIKPPEDANARLGWKADSAPQDSVAYFQQLLGDVEEPTAPFGMLDVQADGPGGNEAELVIEAALVRRLRTSAHTFGASAASLSHLAWALLLARTSGQEDVVYGTVLQGLSEPDRSPIDVVPVRVLAADDSAECSLRRMHELLAELAHHQRALPALAESCGSFSLRELRISSLFLYRRGRKRRDPREELVRPGFEAHGDYPFKLSVDDLGGEWKLTARAPASVGGLRLCHLMRTTLVSLADVLEREPATPVYRLEVMPEEERSRVLTTWNNTETPFPSDKCIHELIEEQVSRRPHAVALVYEDTELTYLELNQWANRLAHYLRAIGVKPDTRVAICVERGFEMIVGMLAVFKAGGCYVALDPAYPVERLSFQLQDCSPVALLTLSHLDGHFSAAADMVPTLYLDAPSTPWDDCADSNPGRDAIGLYPQHLAYVIYTSGSTGKPKGVLCEHRGLCNLAFAQTQHLAVEPQSRVLQFASFGFDACVFEAVMTLCQGAALYLGSRGKMLAGDALNEMVSHYGITHATLPPAVLASMPEDAELATVRVMVLAGEALSSAVAARWARGRKLINAYGPTETTVCATVFSVPAGRLGAPPIGRPIANTKIYILNQRKEPAPTGVAGEIYIGGAGVARGYLNRAELTETKFVPDPFAAEPGARMYRTGDLGRWLPDGNIEFLGRNDFQVKIRGFRVELGEIEARLAEYPGLREAVVVAREDTPGEKYLAAYYTMADGHDAESDTPGAERLRGHICERLPQFMAPSAYVRLQSLPLTVNGKLDRQALPVPGSGSSASREYEPPAGNTEIALAQIWMEFLKVERVGRKDNFFALGGHSLMATRMIARVRSMFGGNIALFAFIQTPTVEYLASLLSGNAIADMAVVNQGSSGALPMIWVAPEPWQPRLTSHLSQDQPVLSFVLSQEELAAAAPEYRLEELAAGIVTKIRRLYPRRAYVLAGFCQTSLLAYECAQQLRRLGHDVPLLVMGDAMLPGYVQRLSFTQRSQRRWQREMFYLSALRNSPPSRWRQILQQRIGGLRAMQEQFIWTRNYRLSERNVKFVDELYQALIVAHLNYRPTAYAGSVLYLQSSHRPQSVLWNSAASWQSLVRGLEVFESPGDHTSIFQEPNVKVTAQRLQLALDRVAHDNNDGPPEMQSNALTLQI